MQGLVTRKSDSIKDTSIKSVKARDIIEISHVTYRKLDELKYGQTTGQNNT